MMHSFIIPIRPTITCKAFKIGMMSKYLIDAPVLDTVNYLRGIIASPGRPKYSASTFMDIIHNLRRQWNCIPSIEASVSSLYPKSHILNLTGS